MVAPKTKVLLISDNMTGASGVGIQSRYLAQGLAATGSYKIFQLGAAIKHQNYDIINLGPDISVKPMDGFNNIDLYRKALAELKPDITILFTDPRFFESVFLNHDEFHQHGPIAYWHLWDQCEIPPDFNAQLYKSVDLFNCINYPTYQFVKSLHPDSTNYIPHAIPDGLYRPLAPEFKLEVRRHLLPPGREEDFVVLFVNRNAHRKRPGDVVWAFKMFLDKLEAQHGHRKATLVMHCDPLDHEGQRIDLLAERFGLQNNIVFQVSTPDDAGMCQIYNSADVVVNISYAEGFGLGTLNAMYCGVPIISNTTGGLTRQVINPYDGTVNGVALKPVVKNLIGNIKCPHIVQDMVSLDDVSDAFLEMYNKSPAERAKIGEVAMKYAKSEYGFGKMISDWDKSIQKTLQGWKSRRPNWTVEDIQ